ncbi:MAG: hypothetical protein BGO98_24950 [Myxococcales bacterium 68-20]|nr:MAG: hypothetical protein BGO98_24950 [Myxococcales bacterium 68-20]
MRGWRGRDAGRHAGARSIASARDGMCSTTSMARERSRARHWTSRGPAIDRERDAERHADRLRTLTRTTLSVSRLGTIDHAHDAERHATACDRSRAQADAHGGDQADGGG